jgi:hypothetical protein
VYWKSFFERSDLEDALSAITLLANQLLLGGNTQTALAGKHWIL